MTLPVTLPRVPHVLVVDTVPVGLFIQEVEHVLNCEWKSAASVHCAEQRLKQVIYKLLQSTLNKGKIFKAITLCNEFQREIRRGFALVLHIY